MAIVTLEQIKEHVIVTDVDDDALLTRQTDAAQNLIERHLGFKIEDCFGGEGQEPIPPALGQAVCLLVAHWYANRETSIAGVSITAIPWAVDEIVREYRTWSF